MVELLTEMRSREKGGDREKHLIECVTFDTIIIIIIRSVHDPRR